MDAARLKSSFLALLPLLFFSAPALPESLSVKSPDPGHRYEVKPEYERRLRRVLLSVPALEGDALEERRTMLLRAVYGEVLQALPLETQIDIAVAARDEAPARRVLDTMKWRESVRLRSLPGASKIDMWAQDLGEPIALDEKPLFAVSALSPPSDKYNHGILRGRLLASEAIFEKSSVIRADFVFEGGNLAFDRTPEGIRIFIGFNDVLATIERDESLGRRATSRNVLERISSFFSGAEVILIGTELQSPLLFHLDQAFVLLAERVAVVARIAGDDDSREARQLALYESHLRSLGYRILHIEHSREDIERYRNSTNAIPFVTEAGERQILFPVFPGEVKGSPEGPLKREDLIGKALAAFEAYTEAGYEATPVRDYTHGARGSTHCIINVID